MVSTSLAVLIWQRFFDSIIGRSLHGQQPDRFVVVIEALNVNFQGCRAHTRVEVEGIRWERYAQPVRHILSIGQWSAQGYYADLALQLILHETNPTGYNFICSVKGLQLVQDVETYSLNGFTLSPFTRDHVPSFSCRYDNISLIDDL